MKKNSLLKTFDFLKAKKIFFFGLFISIVVILIDQFTKYIAMTSVESIILKTNGVHTHIKKTSFFNLVLVWNRGISFGVFNNNNSIITTVLLLIILAIVVYIFYILWKNNNLLLMFCYSLMLGGAIGNIIDRINYGAVIDFIDVHLGDLHWPAFNIADSCICIGVCLYLFYDVVVSKFRNK